MAQSFFTAVLRGIRQALPMVALMFFTQSLITYFFSRKQEAVTVPCPIMGPLKYDVQFDCTDTRFTDDSVIRTPVSTTWGMVECSTEGGAIRSLVYRGKPDENIVPISVITASDERERQAFLIACEQDTPYVYTLVDKKIVNDKTVLRYHARNNFYTLEKTFSIYHAFPKIDLTLTVTPSMEKAEKEATVRIIYPSPHLIEHPCRTDTPGEEVSVVRENKTVGGIVGQSSGQKIEKISYDTGRANDYFVMPSLFGADNRYFINALVRDNNGFVARAYYKWEGPHALYSFIESKPISQSQPTSWTLSFYVGPKDEHMIKEVDPRLEATFSYAGFFAPLCKILLAFLRFLYRILHSYGLAIIVLTLIIKLFLFPFTWRSEYYMKQNNEIEKKLAYLKQRYKNEPEVFAAHQAELFQKHGMPGLKGCLPLLVQMPIFGVLWRVVSGALELYHVSFWWIPDLSAKDPYVILPIIVCLGTVAQRAASGIAGDPRKQFFGIAMSCIFGAMTASLPAGIALYTATNVILSVAQTALLRFFKMA